MPQQCALAIPWALLALPISAILRVLGLWQPKKIDFKVTILLLSFTDMASVNTRRIRLIIALPSASLTREWTGSSLWSKPASNYCDVSFLCLQFSMKDKVIIVTGCNTGIGKRTAANIAKMVSQSI